MWRVLSSLICAICFLSSCGLDPSRQQAGYSAPMEMASPLDDPSVALKLKKRNQARQRLQLAEANRSQATVLEEIRLAEKELEDAKNLLGIAEKELDEAVKNFLHLHPRQTFSLPSGYGNRLYAPASGSTSSHQIYTGPRGGRYHYSASGKKVYERKR